MEDPIEQSRDGGDIAQEFAPVFDRSIGSDDGTRALVTAHDEFEEIFCGVVGKFAHTEIIDDKEVYGSELSKFLFTHVIERSICKVVEKGMGLQVAYSIALFNDRMSYGLGQVTFSSSWRTEKEYVFVLEDKACCGELIDECTIHRFIEVKIESIQTFIVVSKSSFFDTTQKQAVLSFQELIGEEHRQEVEVRKLFVLRLDESWFHGACHSGKPQLPQSSVDFYKIHDEAPILCEMSSR